MLQLPIGQLSGEKTHRLLCRSLRFQPFRKPACSGLWISGDCSVSSPSLSVLPQVSTSLTTQTVSGRKPRANHRCLGLPGPPLGEGYALEQLPSIHPLQSHGGPGVKSHLQLLWWETLRQENYPMSQGGQILANPKGEQISTSVLPSILAPTLKSFLPAFNSNTSM